MMNPLSNVRPPGLCPCGLASDSLAPCDSKRRFLRCRQCGLVAKASIPSDEELARWYREEYWSRYRDEQVGSVRENVYAHAWFWVEWFSPGPGVLVDVGCGGGALLALARTRGWQGIGLDPSLQAVACARTRGLDAYLEAFPPCSLQSETVDVVTFINVLDHLTNPFAALVEARRILRPGGLLYVRLPNGPLHVRLKRTLTPVGLGALAVVHLYGFGVAALRFHLLRLGFEVVTVRTAAPSRGDAYSGSRSLGFGLRLLFKQADRGLYQLLTALGLDRRGWGLSLEAVALKARTESGT